jgi:hypothetical protein
VCAMHIYIYIYRGLGFLRFHEGSIKAL